MKKHLEALQGQVEKNRATWGDYIRTPAEYLLIATEELGEVAEAMQRDGAFYQWPPEYNENVYEELVDLGAVVLSMMEECA